MCLWQIPNPSLSINPNTYNITVTPTQTLKTLTPPFTNPPPYVGLYLVSGTPGSPHSFILTINAG